MAHKVHAGYTVLAPIREGEVEALSDRLRELNGQLPFSAVASLHFATGSVIRPHRRDGEELEPLFLFATSFCGPTDQHERELSEHLGPYLAELFGHCEGFYDDVVAYLRAHRQWDTFYSGMQHLSREDVIRQDRLQQGLQRILDDHAITGDAVSARRQIQEHVAADPELAWALEKEERDPSWFTAMHGPTLVLYAVAGPPLAALVIGTLLHLVVTWPALEIAIGLGWLAVLAAFGLLVVYIAGIRESERAQPKVAGRPSDAHALALAQTQCRPVINEMTIAGPIKGGWAPPRIMRIALWVISRYALGLPYLGKRLGEGITIPTVATARWIAASGGRRLVFISNYTNAAEPYVRDFIDVVAGAMRINITFGWGGEYPRTEFMIARGAIEDPNGFINVVQAFQQCTELWFCPYQHLSIDNITRNRRIREGLPGDADDTTARAWLALL